LASNVSRLGAIALVLGALLGGCASQQGTRSSSKATGGPQPSGEEGAASFYGAYHHGKLTASGEAFDMNGLTAAHRKFRFGTCVRVEHLANRRTVEVRVNDRGPFTKGRIIDLSEGAAKKLGMVSDGVARVRLHPCKGKR
jgi:rare lipoprotein A